MEHIEQPLGIILDNLQDYDEELVIMTKNNQDITKDTFVILVKQDEINEYKEKGYNYFLELFLAREIIDVWSKWRNNKKPTLDEKIKAIIYYSINDAYLPVDNK